MCARKHYQGPLSKFCLLRVKFYALANNICTTLCETIQLIQSQFVAVIIFCVLNISSKVDNTRTFFLPVDDFTTYEDNNCPINLAGQWFPLLYILYFSRNSLPVDLHGFKRKNIFWYNLKARGIEVYNLSKDMLRPANVTLDSK